MYIYKQHFSTPFPLNQAEAARRSGFAGDAGDVAAKIRFLFYSLFKKP